VFVSPKLYSSVAEFLCLKLYSLVAVRPWLYASVPPSNEATSKEATSKEEQLRQLWSFCDMSG